MPRPVAYLCAGQYEELRQAAVVLIASGVNEQAGGASNRSDPPGRLKLFCGRGG
jgi:L-lactate dehydrogenase